MATRCPGFFVNGHGLFQHCGNRHDIEKDCNYSVAIYPEGEKPFCLFPIFFRELLGLVLNWQKLGLKASGGSPVLAQKAFESLIRK